MTERLVDQFSVYRPIMIFPYSLYDLSSVKNCAKDLLNTYCVTGATPQCFPCSVDVLRDQRVPTIQFC